MKSKIIYIFCRKTQPTGWARYPAAGLLGVAILSFIEGARFQEIWPAAVMLVIGVMFLMTLLTRKHIPAGRQVPKLKA